MIMATISENLQIIKNSTDAIKQAIIDKGIDVSGDITTWANAISGISGGGSGGSGDSTTEINNVYINAISNYISAPGTITMNVFCTLEKPLDVSMRAYVFSNDGEMIFQNYIIVQAGATEFEFTSVSGDEFNFSSCFSVILSDFYSLRMNTKYTFKYNYL